MPEKEVMLDARWVRQDGTVQEGCIGEIFASRVDLGKVKIISKTQFGACFEDRVKIHFTRGVVEYGELGPKDFIVRRSERFEKKRYPACTGPIYDYELIAGTPPEWATFYQRWRDWVYNQDVRNLAMASINSIRLPFGQIEELHRAIGSLTGL